MLLHLWFPLIWYATWQCSEKVDFWPIGRVRGMGPGKIVATMLLHFVIPFNLICNMTMLWKGWILTYWPGQGGVYVCVWEELRTKYLLPCCCISWFHLIWYATWPCSEKVEFRPIVPSLGFWGRGYASKIFATMLLHSWFSLIWYAPLPYSEKLNLNLLTPSPGSGMTAGKIFATMLLHLWFYL